MTANFGENIPKTSLFIAILLILAGGLCTYFTARSVHVHLREGECSNVTNTFFNEDLSDSNSTAASTLPFSIHLERFDIEYHEGTRTPKDYISHITLIDNSIAIPIRISMNKIGRYHGYRIFQEDYDTDLDGSVLLVRYDPWGTTLVYIGFALLLLSMIWLLLRRDGAFRRLLRALSLACLLMLSLPTSARSDSGDRVQNSEFKIKNSNNQLSVFSFQLSVTEAAAFGRLSVYYRGRIAPFDSYARDYCKANFPKGKIPAGYNPVQLVTEIYLFPEKWPDQVRPAMKLFPQQEHWFAPDDDLNSADPADTLFIAHILDWLKLSIQESNQQQNTQIINSIYQFQEKRCTAGSIKRQREQIEIAYNQYKPESKIFLMEIIMAVVLLVLFLAVPNAKWTKTLALIFMFVALTFVLADIGLRCYLSGHSPFSGLFDTLMLLSAGVLLIGLFVSRKSGFITLPSLIASAFIILVATMMGGRSFSPLMPVLISPWLTIHVAILMTAYSMLTFTFILALISIPLIILKRKQELVQNITKISQVFCIIGVVLLATGIIIGSAWANISWGQYWSWDPKETWALITLIGYCAALPGVIPAADRHPWLYHLIILIAFCLLIMTYLGINLFGGMHAYN